MLVTENIQFAADSISSVAENVTSAVTDNINLAAENLSSVVESAYSLIRQKTTYVSYCFSSVIISKKTNDGAVVQFLILNCNYRREV